MTHATQENGQHQTDARGVHPDEGQPNACPPWCVRHDRVDQGTPDEFLVHIAESRHVEGVCIDLRQVEFVDGHRERPFLYVNGVEMSANSAVRFAAELLSTMAVAIAPVIAASTATEQGCRE